MKRIAIIGCPGSGKSTLAVQLASKTGLPLFPLDEAFHDSSRWSTDKYQKKEEWRKYQEELVKNGEWIIDGNYKGTLEIRIAAADTIIFLDYPRWLCIWRVLHRYFKNDKPAGGNPDKIDFSFLRFIWNYRRQERSTVLSLLEKYRKNKEIHVVASPNETEKLLIFS